MSALYMAVSVYLSPFFLSPLPLFSVFFCPLCFSFSGSLSLFLLSVIFLVFSFLLFFLFLFVFSLFICCSLICVCFFLITWVCSSLSSLSYFSLCFYCSHSLVISRLCFFCRPFILSVIDSVITAMLCMELLIILSHIQRRVLLLVWGAFLKFPLLLSEQQTKHVDSPAFNGRVNDG